jgi:CelD/BcsL family acetyltransferase involved in cellulose biosynthesis
MDTAEQGLSVDVLKPGALSAGERGAWRAFLAASDRLASPYFRPEYAQAADGVAPGAAVAVAHRAGRIAAFLPFQKRGSVAQPLAAPLSDYHGLIRAPGETVSLEAVVRLLGVCSYRFSGLVTEAPPSGGRCIAHAPVAADVSGGWDAYLAARPGARKFFKDKERALRAAERDLGPLEFRFEDAAPGALDFVVAHKREQYRRTARHDIFACGWTKALLRRLWEERTAEFGGRLATLRADGRLIAAQYDLQAGGVRHVWFTAYDAGLASYGPGALLMVQAMKAAAADPALSVMDFGREGEGFKRYFASPAGVVYEGSVEAEAWRRVSVRAGATLGAVPALMPLVAVGERMRRRFAIIEACETTAAGRLGGAADAFRHASRRGPALAGS